MIIANGRRWFYFKELPVHLHSHKHQDACGQVGRPASRRWGVFPAWPARDSWRRSRGQGMLAVWSLLCVLRPSRLGSVCAGLFPWGAHGSCDPFVCCLSLLSITRIYLLFFSGYWLGPSPITESQNSRGLEGTSVGHLVHILCLPTTIS